MKCSSVLSLSLHFERDLSVLAGKRPIQTIWWELMEQTGHNYVNRLLKCGHHRLPGQLLLSLPPHSLPHLMILLFFNRNW